MRTLPDQLPPLKSVKRARLIEYTAKKLKLDKTFRTGKQPPRLFGERSVDGEDLREMTRGPRYT